MKPDWKDAPDWANWLAMDRNREWCWYEKEPHQAGYIWSSEGGQYLEVKIPYKWTETKEAKPK